LEKWIPLEKQEAAIDDTDIIQQCIGSIEIMGVDTGKGITMSGGTLDKYFQTLAVFRREIPNKISGIKTCLEETNLPLFTIYAHALKSSAANIGAIKLSEMAEVMETAGLNGDLDFILTFNDKFCSGLEELLDNISRAMSAREVETENNSVDTTLLKDGLSRLKEAMIDYDTPIINETAKDLQAFIQVAGIEEILQCKLLGEYDGAITLIDELFVRLREEGLE
jgi:HPt (histidine-containing phosphotransfer) domain-containing protein